MPAAAVRAVPGTTKQAALGIYHKMTSALRTFEDFQASLRCFDWLPDTGVSGGSDIDLLLERHGHFLVLEAKRREGPQVYVALGQFIALRNLAALPAFTVMLVAEDEQSKNDTSLPRYSWLFLGPDTKPHAMGLRNGQKHAVFYTDNNFGHGNLPALQGVIRHWWDTA